ncbi:MAG: thiamine phosphate synthase [Candidatus Omnitrophota bacterium]|jgi:thiamine-phosphate pyrophosphorylase
MDWKKKLFDDFRLYAVTDLKIENPDVFKEIEAAYRGGADIVQLRSKVLADAALMRLGLRIKKIAEKNHKLFFVNDRVDLALAIGADGVHLGQRDMPIRVVRTLAKQAGRKIWIGKSTHSLKQALMAVSEGADYIGVGPVFMTPTKPHVKSVGLRFVKQAAIKIRIPWVAIGGIDLGNIRDVAAAGAARVAVIRAIFAAQNPESAARKLKRQLEGI